MTYSTLGDPAIVLSVMPVSSVQNGVTAGSTVRLTYEWKTSVTDLLSTSTTTTGSSIISLNFISSF